MLLSFSLLVGRLSPDFELRRVLGSRRHRISLFLIGRKEGEVIAVGDDPFFLNFPPFFVINNFFFALGICM